MAQQTFSLTINPASGFQWPGANADATIAAGQTVTLDSLGAEVRDLEIYGTLQIADVPTSLTFRTMTVHPGGAVLGNVTTSCDLIIRDTPLVTSDSNGIKCFGTFRLQGAVKDVAHMRPSVEPLAGHTTLTLERVPAGWQVGDKLVIHGTRHLNDYSYFVLNYPMEYESLTIAGIFGNVLTLAAPLAYDHRFIKNYQDAVEYRPFIQNLTRNVVIKSENMNGVRGHTWFEGRADVDIRYVKFGGLGRRKLDGTGGGAVPVHFHHLYGQTTPQANGYQFTFIGNAITCPLDPMPYVWPLALHDSHFGLVKDNDVHNWSGSGIVTWDGSETQNVIEGNRVTKILGNGERVDVQATAGSGIWCRGPDNYLRNNAVANCAPDKTIPNVPPYTYGINAMMGTSVGVVTIPAFQGADKAVNGLAVNMNTDRGFRQVEGNTVCACYNGLTVWWVGTNYETPGNVSSSITNQGIFQTYNWGIFLYESNQLTIDNLTYIVTDMSRLYKGVYFADYMARRFTLKNSRIENGWVGLPINTDVRGTDSDPTTGHVYFDNCLIVIQGIGAGPPSSVNGSGDLCKRIVHLHNTRFVNSPTHIRVNEVVEAGMGGGNLTLDNRILVTDYNGTAEDFTVQPAYRPPLPNPLPDRPAIDAKLFQT